MRLFIGIELAPLLKERISQATADLRRLAVGKWVEQHNLHVTMGFIGEVADDSLVIISDALTKALRGRAAFDLWFDRLIGIPQRSPRLLMLTTNQSRQYIYLREEIVKNLAAINISMSVSDPHITLARLKQPLKAPLPKMSLRFRLQVTSVSLIHSTLTAKGPIYRPLIAPKMTYKRPFGPLRPNIAICIVNPRNEVLLVKHRDHVKSYWQFPQGGVASETPEETVGRELGEELGLSEYMLLGIWPNIYRYLWPKKLLMKKSRDPEKRNYIGQEQSLAIVRVGQVRPRLKPDPREAMAVQWFPIPKVITALNPIRRHMGKLAMVKLSKIINSEK